MIEDLKSADSLWQRGNKNPSKIIADDILR